MKMLRGKFRSVAAPFALVAMLCLGLAACGSDNKSSSSDKAASSGGATSTAAAPAAASGGGAEMSKCGAGNGQKATGAPIKIGAVATKQPGTDFTDMPNGAKAYFDCVNDNGGINGRPIEMLLETEQTDPGQAAAAAKKLIDGEKVVAMAGNGSIIECAVNHKYYEAKGYNVIAAGIAPECYGTSNIAAVNMGPRYSSDGAVQALIGKGVKKIVFDQSNVPGTGYIEAGPKLIAKEAGVPIETFKDNVPIQDANSIAVKLVQAAGQDGGVVLNFTPPEALKILKAAEQQGLQDKVKWGCSTPCNTDFLADALGSAWNDKLFVNAELNVTDFDGPDSNLYRDILKKYAPKLALGSFSQMGFVIGKAATTALLSIKGEVNAKTANEAIGNLKDVKTDILCRPFYFGKAPLHLPNNVDWTTTPKDGKMVINEDCFEISDAEPAVKKVREIEAGQ
jgi:branched-chain amino acid transport system substrate-binding protein